MFNQKKTNCSIQWIILRLTTHIQKTKNINLNHESVCTHNIRFDVWICKIIIMQRLDLIGTVIKWIMMILNYFPGLIQTVTQNCCTLRNQHIELGPMANKQPDRERETSRAESQRSVTQTHAWHALLTHPGLSGFHCGCFQSQVEGTLLILRKIKLTDK